MKYIIPLCWILSFWMIITSFVWAMLESNSSDDVIFTSAPILIFLIGSLMILLTYICAIIIYLIKSNQNNKNSMFNLKNLEDKDKGFKYRENFDCACWIFLTLGIYFLYWIYKITEELKNEPNPINWRKDGYEVLLLIIITFGVYYWWWTKYVYDALNRDSTKELNKTVKQKEVDLASMNIFEIQKKINLIIDGKAGDSDYNLIYKKYSKK